MMRLRIFVDYLICYCDSDGLVSFDHRKLLPQLSMKRSTFPEKVGESFGRCSGVIDLNLVVLCSTILVILLLLET